MGRKLLLLLCISLLLGSCNYIPSGSIEDALVAPHINERQAEVHAALGATLNLSEIQYKYPQQGDYRSPFILYDLDGDERQECIVFYAYNSSPTVTRAKVLREDVDGSWYSAYDITGGGDQVDFIQFADLRGDGSQSILIGWQSNRRTSTLGVYSIVGDGLEEDFTQVYTDYLVGDFSGGGRSEIVVIWQDEQSRFQMSLLGLGKGGYIQQISRFSMAVDGTHVLQLTHGMLWDGTIGIYTDILLDGTTTATEIVRATGNRLEPVAAEIGGEDFSSTFRDDDTALCVDLEGDGVIEIPTLLPLAGQEETPELPEIFITEYLHLNANGFVPQYRALVNEEQGYLLHMPDRWEDQVTVRRVLENGEWQFYKIDLETGEQLTELLRIRVYSIRDYMDQFLSNYTMLEEKGLLQYYAYIPRELDDPLAVTMDEVQTMFQLL